jgi:sugar lactone lactonase YvrE
MHIGLNTKTFAIGIASALFATGIASSMAQAPSFLPTLVTIAGDGTAGFSGDGASATAAELSNTVAGATMDPAGNIYIADYGNNRIRKITPAGIITTFAGTGTAEAQGSIAAVAGDGGLAINAELNNPGSVRYHQGALYVTEFTGWRIRKIDLTSNIITTIVGGCGCTAQLNNASNGNNVQGTAIEVGQPQDTAFDSLGNMYWSEGNGASRVNVLNLSTGVVHLFAGTGGTKNATGTNIGAASSTLTAPEETILNGPAGLAVDSQNNVYIAEYSTNVIRKVTVGTVPAISTYAGIGIASGAAICTSGALNSLGDGCPATGAQFGAIEHMSIDGAGNLYVADSTNDRIRFIPPNPNDPTVGGTVSTYAGGTGTTTESPDGTYASAATLLDPFDAQILPDGDMLLVDRTDSLVRLLHLPGSFVSTSAGTAGAPQTFNVLTPASTGTFTLPATTEFTGSAATTSCAAAIGPSGEVPSGNVCSYTVTFQPTIAGTRTTPLTFVDGNNNSVVAGLSGMGLAPAVSLLPGLAATAAGSDTSGATGDGGAATAATFEGLSAVAADSMGNVYVADAAANEVRKFTPGGNIVRVAGTGTSGSSGDGAVATSATLNTPSGVAVDAAGNVYIADTGNNKIRMVSAATGDISTIAGTGTAGYTGDQGTPAAATLNAPMQLAWSPLGILYVADTGNSVVREIALNEQLITTFAGNGTQAFDGDGGVSQAAELASPQSVAVDGNGVVYIADTGNNRIREVSEGEISTIAGQTSSGFNGDGTAANATLTAPQGVAADTAGNVYVADTGNDRVRVISAGQIATVMGGSTVGATGDGGSSAQAELSGPAALAVAPAENLYIADSGNYEVRSISVQGNTLAFKTANPTESSPVQTVSVYNSGNEALSVGSVTGPPAGYIEEPSTSGTDCTSAPLTLAPASSCNFNTVFNPPTIGNYDGAITIADNNENVPKATQSIQLQATSAVVYTATLTLPSTATAGTAVAGTLSIANPLQLYTGTVSFTSTDPQAVLPANQTFTTADNGSLAVSVTLKTAGIQCVTATDTMNPSVTSTACVTVSAANAAKIAVYSGNNQTANIDTTYAQRLVALATDSYGNPVGTVPVTFTINPANSVTAAFSNSALTYSTSSTLGYATALPITPGGTVGTFTVTASLPGTSATTTFTMNIDVVGSFTITPASTQVGPIAPGTTYWQPLLLTASGGFTSPITFTCTAPAGITCSAGPQNTSPFYISEQSSNPALVSFTSQGSLLANSSGFVSPWGVIGALATGLLLYWRRRKASAVILPILALAVLSTISACGKYYAPVTPNGSYTVTVTGTAQIVSASTSITYTVQK